MAAKTKKQTGILGYFKLHESTISMALGALVILVVGVLIVNYFRNIPGKGDLSGEGITTEEEQAKMEKVELGETYTVKKGETLWEIAEKHYSSGYNWVDIAKENGLTDPNEIEEGQKLVIPAVEAKAKTVEDTKMAETKTNTQTGTTEVNQVNKIDATTYTVQHGDNLWEIAVRAYGDGYQWVKIAQANKLSNPDIIHSGNVLTLPR